MVAPVSSVLLAASAGLGAAQHLPSIAEALLARGHRVSVASGEAARQHFAGLDVEFHAVPEVGRPELQQTLPPMFQRARQVHARMQQMVIDPLPGQWTVVRRLLERAEVDVVVTDPLYLAASGICFTPRAGRPAVVLVGFYPPWVPDPGLAPYGLGAAPLDAGPGGHLLAAALELASAPAYSALSRSFNRQVERTFGVLLKGDLRLTPLHGDSWVQLTVPRFEYPRTALPSKLEFIGPLRPPAEDPLPDWWDPVREPPVVAVRADGATAVRDLVLPTIGAFRDAADTVVIAGTTREEVACRHRGPLPANVHFEERIPWSRLIPKRSVVVSDGDYLHTQHALRFGIPVVSAGTLETDVETAARIEWSGAGVNLRQRRPSSSEILEAVQRIRADDAFRLAAARIAAQIAATDAEGSICTLVEQHAAARV